MYKIVNKKGKLRKSNKGKVVFSTHDEKLRDEIFDEDYQTMIKKAVLQLNLKDKCVNGQLYKFIKIFKMKANERFKHIYYGNVDVQSRRMVDSFIILLLWFNFKDLKVVYGYKGKTKIKCLKVKTQSKIFYFMDKVVEMGNNKSFILIEQPYNNIHKELTLDQYFNIHDQLKNKSVTDQFKIL